MQMESTQKALKRISGCCKMGRRTYADGIHDIVTNSVKSTNIKPANPQRFLEGNVKLVSFRVVETSSRSLGGANIKQSASLRCHSMVCDGCILATRRPSIRRTNNTRINSALSDIQTALSHQPPATCSGDSSLLKEGRGSSRS